MRLHPSRIIAECPLCKESFRDAEVRLVQQHNPSKLYHCECKTCLRGLLVCIADHHGWVSTVCLATDMGFEDAVAWSTATPIDHEEYQSLVRLMDLSSKDFCRVLTKREENNG